MSTTRPNQQKDENQHNSTFTTIVNATEIDISKHINEAINSLELSSTNKNNPRIIETPIASNTRKSLVSRHFFFSDTESSSPSSPTSSEGPFHEEKSNWVEYNDLSIHQGFFNKGLIVVKQSMSGCDFTNVDDSVLFVKERELLFSETQKKTSAEFEKANKLLLAIKSFVGEKEQKNNLNLSITNTKRREEVFLPLKLQEEGGENNSPDVGSLYIYPWLSSGNSGNKFAFAGFKQYVTAGCLFGSNLIGIDEKGYKCALIKHDIDFYEKQKIQHIQLTSNTLGPYEVALFKELEGLALFINQYADKKSGQPSLFYHLPSHDYMLFGIELYIRNRMTLGALTQFLKYVCLQKIKHQEKINSICRKYNINVEISSPFENIFGDIKFDPKNKKAAENFTQAVLARLGVLAKDDNLQKMSESVFVENCLNLLTNYKTNEKSHQAWVDFLKTSQKEISNIKNLAEIAKKRKDDSSYIELYKVCKQQFKAAELEELDKYYQNVLNIKNDGVTQVLTDYVISKIGVNSIEKLFKIANSLMLGIAAFGKKDYETCSILPLPEKQIQVNYDKLRKEKDIATYYPGIFCATYIPSVISYASCDVKNNGLLFYFGENLEVLNNIIERLARPANENMLKYITNSKEPLNELSDILFDNVAKIDTVRLSQC